MTAGIIYPLRALAQQTWGSPKLAAWKITELGAGAHSVTNEKSGLVLTTGSGADGALVTQQPADGSVCQQWQIA
ncbi:RICIN domain-containing protein [Streptomyces sp. NPDC054797]